MDENSSQIDGSSINDPLLNKPRLSVTSIDVSYDSY
jgi:hypothetical protein